MKNKRIIIDGKSQGIYLNQGVTKTKIDSIEYHGYGYSDKNYIYRNGSKRSDLDTTAKVKITNGQKNKLQRQATIQDRINGIMAQRFETAEKTAQRTAQKTYLWNKWFKLSSRAKKRYSYNFQNYIREQRQAV